jgi:hypothetical protein
LRPQHFNNNEELIEGVKTWMSKQAADFCYKVKIKAISVTGH